MTLALESQRGPASRRYPRRHIRGRAITQIKGKSQFAQVLQIGEGGMLLTVPERVGVGQTLLVEFLLPRGKIALYCEVLYLMPPPSKQSSCVGVRFTGISDVARQAIRSFVTQGTHYTMKKRAAG